MKIFVFVALVIVTDGVDSLLDNIHQLVILSSSVWNYRRGEHNGIYHGGQIAIAEAM